MRVPAVLILILTLLGSETGAPNAWAQDKRPEAAKVPEQVVKDLGAGAVAILSGATKVEVFRLEKQPVAKPGKGTIGLDEF